MTLLYLLFVPLTAIFLIMLRLPAKQVAISAALLNFSFSLAILGFFFQTGLGNYQFEFDMPWMYLPGLPTIHFHLGLDGISAPLIFLTTTVTLAATAISPSQCKRPKEFFIYLLLLSMGALGAFLSLDLFFFFIFHEFALIPTFLLIGIWGSQNRQFASMQLTLYLTLGSLVLLGGILALVMQLPEGQRTFDLPQIQAYFSQHPLPLTIQTHIAPLFLIGFGILVSLFPFHSWAPSGYATAPPGVAMLHAGVLKKFGIYGLIRVAIPLLPAGFQAWEWFLGFLLLGNILFIGFTTIAQKELPAMLGFSSVMHMGYFFLGLAAFNTLGFTGVIILMVAHGLSAALLFGLAGEIQQRTGENRMVELGGLAQRAPFLCIAFIIGSLASVGMPGLANFPGEILIFFGAFAAASPLPWWLTSLAIWGIVLSAVYSFRAISSIFFGKLPERYQEIRDLEGFSQRAPYVLLILALLFVGWMPHIIATIAQPSLEILFRGGL